MVVAIAAFVIALAGTAAATFGPFKGNKIIKKHSLSGNRLKNDTISGTQVKESTLGKVPSASVADNANTLGGQSAGSFEGKSRWALVKADGTVLASSGGITVDHLTGRYFVNFGSSVTGRPITATLHEQGGTGIIRAAPCGGATADAVTCTQDNDGNHVYVAIFDTSSAFLNHDFYIVVGAP